MYLPLWLYINVEITLTVFVIPTYRILMINVNINVFFDNKFVVRYIWTLKLDCNKLA